MKRNLVLASLIVVLVASTASAQVTYQVTTTPTFVINTGRTEALGNIRTTAQNTTTTIASTIQYLFQGISCDNDETSGMVLNSSGALAAAAFATPVAVVNGSAGCVVSVTVAGGIAVTAGDFVEIQGVRGRIDFLGGITNVGQNINGSLSATPSNSSLFTVPNVGVVGITAVGLEFTSVTLGQVLQCVGTASTQPVLRFKEGFNGAFVQHAPTVLGSTIPFANRPTFGANGNTQIRIVISNLPSGVTLSWPATTEATNNTGFTATTQGAGSRLERLTTATATSQTYEYAAGDQSQADLITETFVISPTLTATATAAFGTGTVQIRLFPDLLATGEATSITSAPFPGTANISSVTVVRFNDPFRPDPGAGFASNAPCRTNLLFPFVANIAGFDTGIAISNTSADPYGTAPQSGDCRLFGWEATTGAAVGATPPFATLTAVASGATASILLSGTDFAGGSGYVIAICDFQFAHGFAFITDNFGVGAPNTAQGYLALIIPDPPLNVGRIANDSSGGTANSGENLGQ